VKPVRLIGAADSSDASSVADGQVPRRRQ